MNKFLSNKDLPVNFTSKAVDMILIFSDKKQANDKILRISIEGGGCSGFKYNLNFIKNIEKNDIVFKHNKNFYIVIDIISLCYLQNTTVDYIKSINGSGFSFKNQYTLEGCKGC